MPIPTPFHSRASAACVSLRFKDWAGHYAVCAYDTYHEREYFALRNAAGMIDVSPLYKYEVSGPDAAAFLSYATVRDITRLKLGQVAYGCWCDHDGKVIDDGTFWRLGDTDYRLTAAEPNFSWLSRLARGFDVTIEDSSARIGALSVQGPYSRAVLGIACADDIADLRFFRLKHTKIAGVDVTVTRTGYTGDLGYEVWVCADDAPPLWDALIEAGRPYGLLPAGLDAMDMTRVEAGFVLNGVDYFPAHHCMIDSRKSSPYELGLGWTVKLDRPAFVGQEALRAEYAGGSAWSFVGLVIDWDHYEALFAEHGLPPEVCGSAWRSPVPIFARNGKQVGYASSGTWSPILKKNLALATIETPHAALGTLLDFEITVEFERRKCRAVVERKPFFDPPRKKE